MTLPWIALESVLVGGFVAWAVVDLILTRRSLARERAARAAAEADQSAAPSPREAGHPEGQ